MSLPNLIDPCEMCGEAETTRTDFCGADGCSGVDVCDACDAVTVAGCLPGDKCQSTACAW